MLSILDSPSYQLSGPAGAGAGAVFGAAGGDFSSTSGLPRGREICSLSVNLFDSESVSSDEASELDDFEVPLKKSAPSKFLSMRVSSGHTLEVSAAEAKTL